MFKTYPRSGGITRPSLAQIKMTVPETHVEMTWTESVTVTET